MNILVRLPNWLGDVVMSLGFLEKLNQDFPDSTIDVIVKKGLEEIVLPVKFINQVFSFSKSEYKGIAGVWKYGKKLAGQKKYDVFFCLPDSFSSALMGYAVKARIRIGYKKELRSLLLTHSFKKAEGLHRVETYFALIDYFFKQKKVSGPGKIELPKINTDNHSSYIVINVNSEAISRRLPVKKSVELIELLQKKYHQPFKLVGGPNDLPYVQEIYERLDKKNNVEILAGKTNLRQLIEVIQQASLVVSTDSGPAHIASASDVPLVVIFGAGDEQHTGPYHNPKAIVVRHGQLSCEPCVKNTCKWQTLPLCLEQLELKKIMDAADKLLKNEFV